MWGHLPKLNDPGGSEMNDVKVNNAGVPAMVGNHVRFLNNNNTLKGRTAHYTPSDYGYLDRAWSNELSATILANEGTYIVWSYGTPIAWWDESTGEWVMPRRS